VPRGNFIAESTLSIIFTLEGSRHNDGLYGTGFEYRWGKRFFLPSNRPYQLWGPLSHLFSGYRDSFPIVKRPVYEVDHSPPPSA
jgi:hypothetical protein